MATILRNDLRKQRHNSKNSAFCILSYKIVLIANDSHYKLYQICAQELRKVR